ncbi:class I SAM-dependent methyltransferase [Actinosynnema sp. NPDC023587]|uniref:class I SAM-dependent methyltransferase n=1 Tax=Actinosynnema sp. NPDC023587 TaxID=3154695 RepID=UPI0033F2FDEC
MEHHPLVSWPEHGLIRSARWASRHRLPESLVTAGDELRADHFVRWARRGRAVLWRGDHRTARQVLAAAKRRLEPRATGFREHRLATARRAHLLSRLVVELDAGHRLALRHGPDVADACGQVLPAGPLLIPLTELLGVLGAHRWRTEGLRVPVLDRRIHPHHGVFAPTRQEYLDLVAGAPWPDPVTAFDIGTGTGVLALLLAHRGARHVVATDVEPRAVACARENTAGHGIEVLRTDLFPPCRADLVVCNPPWLPGVPGSSLDAAVYDPGSAMLRGFLHGLPHHLTPGGEGWLVLSDLAERLGLRTRDELTGTIAAAGLTVLDRLDVRPRHRTDRGPFAAQRAAEVVSLWRLAVADRPATPGVGPPAAGTRAVRCRLP